jgi:maleylpyruvate isomerase
MISPVSADLPAGAVGSLLTALDVATDDLSASLARATGSELAEPSLLDGWSRAHVVAHLANVAAALVRMTHDALADRTTSMYPDGRAGRATEIQSVAAEPWEDLHAWFVQSTGALTSTWHSVPWERWGRPFTDTEFGSMQFGRLVGMRLTEVEVHHADLAIGFGPREWSPALTRTCLPLRVASLARLRRSSDADHTINGSWILQCDDLDRRWSVFAQHGEVRIDEIEPSHHDSTTSDVVLRGTALDLTAVLLGRQDPAMLAVSGDADRAAAFKRAFPGP